MFAAADRAYIATQDYVNGGWRFKAGQFVVITDPEFLGVLERDGILVTLHEIDGSAFLGKAQGKAPAAEDGEDGEDKTEETKPNATVAGGKVLGANRQHARGETRKG